MGTMYNTPYPDDMMTSAMTRSMHPGGVNMCFCDGSVHFITDQIDEPGWCRLSSKNDGQDLAYDYANNSEVPMHRFWMFGFCCCWRRVTVTGCGDEGSVRRGGC